MTTLATGVHGTLVEPVGPSRAGVLVLAGSSGRVDVDRARLFARHGATALALQWFGGPGQPAGICEVPLETFTRALDLLRDRAPGPLAVVGTSKGAEAALAVAVVDQRVDAVVALAPPSVVWANVGPGRDGVTYPYRSSWTWRGRPLPFVSYDEDWEPGPDPQSYLECYRRSLLLDPGRTAAATLDVVAARADLLLVAGEDDRMWPSASSARELGRLRHKAGRQVDVVCAATAGHRVLLPGEPALAASTRLRYGGSEAADRALGESAWGRILPLLGLAQ